MLFGRPWLVLCALQTIAPSFSLRTAELGVPVSAHNRGCLKIHTQLVDNNSRPVICYFVPSQRRSAGKERRARASC